MVTLNYNMTLWNAYGHAEPHFRIGERQRAMGVLWAIAGAVLARSTTRANGTAARACRRPVLSPTRMPTYGLRERAAGCNNHFPCK